MILAPAALWLYFNHFGQQNNKANVIKSEVNEQKTGSVQIKDALMKMDKSGKEYAR